MKKKEKAEELKPLTEEQKDPLAVVVNNIVQSIGKSLDLDNKLADEYKILINHPSPWALNADMCIPNLHKVAATVKATDEDLEEWIWVDGYKGTDKDMKCRDFQFELGKEFYHEGDVSICHSGFHFCQKLEDVFDYYDIGRERRFFKVRALVNKKRYIQGAGKDTSKAIIFTEELSQEDVLKVAAERHPEIKALPAIYFGTLFKRGVNSTVNEWRIDQLVSLGYCRELSDYIVTILREFSVAYALASQPGLSMDTKVNLIFNETKRRPF